MTGWAIDLGTTNTGVSRWDREAASPTWVALANVCREPDASEPLRAPLLVPSATEVTSNDGIADRFGRSGLFSRHTFWGRWAFIGRTALSRNQGQARPGYAACFKPYLGRAPLRTLARNGQRAISVREVASCFCRELLAEIKQSTGERLRQVVVTTPVESFESYRMELVRIFTELGCKKVRFVDEPVAAALGYGVGIKKSTLVLVVDFGGGTLDLALVRLDPRTTEQGAGEVIAKAGVPLGGNDVDRWIAADLSQHLGYDLSRERDGVWSELLVSESRRAKEAVYFDGSATCFAMLPEELRRFEARLAGGAGSYELTRDRLKALLERHAVYAALEGCLAEIEQQASHTGQPLSEIDDVLMVGGSTLLPDVYLAFELRFGRQKVRAWQPFEAVAFGAAAFSAGEFASSDFIVHDYAFVTHDPRTHEPTYTTIVPAGTRFPTRPDHWKRQLVPTCALGVPETLFKLVVCELGGQQGVHRRFGWDEQGRVHDLAAPGEGPAYVVRLNESSPTLGFLNPPHEPDDRKPRLEIAFGVNAERWLVATVKDLKTGKQLLQESPVVRMV